MRSVSALALLALACLALSGCGNQGPLVLPVKPSPAATPAAAGSAPAPAAAASAPATRPR